MLQDIQFAARVLIKWRWMTAVAVLALALGIGANSAVFTFVNAVLLRGVPFPDPDRVVAISTLDARARQSGVSYYDFLDWREAARSFSDISLMAQPSFNVSEKGTSPERYSGAYRISDHVPADWCTGAARARFHSRGRSRRRYACRRARIRHLAIPLRRRSRRAREDHQGQ